MSERRTTRIVIPASEAKRLVAKMDDYISKADADRIAKVLSLVRRKKKTRAQMSACLEALFPDKSEDKKQDAFRTFRSRFAKAAAEASLSIALSVDSRKRDTPEDRECWFTINAADDTARKVARLASLQIASQDNSKIVPTRGKVVSVPQIKIFVAASDEHDKALVDKVLDRLTVAFRTSGQYDYELWHEGRDLLVGEIRHATILAAQEQATFTLLMLSNGLLGRLADDINLQALIDNTERPVIPMLLKPIPASANLRGLDRQKIFQSGNGKAFDELARSAHQEQFANGLCDELTELLSKRTQLEVGALVTGTQIESVRLSIDDFANDDDRGLAHRADQELADPLLTHEGQYEAHAYSQADYRKSAKALLKQRGLENDALGERFVPPRGTVTGLDDSLTERSNANTANGIDMLGALKAWLRDATTDYGMILGEYGLGKTTLLKKLAYELLDAHRDDSSQPIPIFIDLRAYSATLHAGQLPANVDVLLDEMLSGIWQGDTPDVTAADILRLVREEGAVLIFDGLDEKLVHLDERQGQAFIRLLWQALPPYRTHDHNDHDDEPRRGRLIFSCRSHYFKTLRAQNTLFRGEDREGMQADLYRAWLLLPFSDDQIEAYLRQTLGEENVDGALTLLHSVHNLEDLAQRPYLLFLMSQHIPELERLRIEGKEVRGVTLYNLLVEKWLDRDEGKHQLQPEDKLTLMERIAADMWRDGAREWEWKKVHEWLSKELARDEGWRFRYGRQSIEVLEEDFRTATLVLRPGDREDGFRFAHTSLQEFFLARALFQAALANDTAVWHASMPSTATLQFLGQLLQTSNLTKHKQVLSRLAEWLGGAPKVVARNALKYWLIAIRHALPEPVPTKIDLSGADLRGWQIHGRSSVQPINLADADLSNAKLDRSEMKYVSLRGATLRNANLTNATLQYVDAEDTNFSNTNLTGSLNRFVSTSTATKFTNAKTYECGWVQGNSGNLPRDIFKHGHTTQNLLKNGESMQHRNELMKTPSTLSVVEHCHFSPNGNYILSASWDHTVKIWDASTGQCLRSFDGHENAVITCSFSPDGRCVLSASADGTIRLWNAHTGNCIRTFEGHTSMITSCTYSLNGKNILSTSFDRTVKLWDVGTGQCLRTFVGHESRTTGCAISPDGKIAASASFDHTIKLWDTRTGKCLMTLLDHEGQTTSCKFSADGRRIVSSSVDHTAKLWDARTGKCIRTFEGHQNRVSACEFSSEGSNILTAAFDRTIKLWDVQTGECVRTFYGHGDVVTACTFSPDGNGIISASRDHSVKLWDVPTGHCLRTFEGHTYGITNCAFSPKGDSVLSTFNGDVLKLWHADDGRCLRTFEGHKASVAACAFSPKGNHILSASWDGTLRLWDESTGHCLHVFEGHNDAVAACAFSADGERVLSASWDHTVKLWDSRTGVCLNTFEGHQDWVTACAFSPNGDSVLSTSDDQTMKLWDTQSGDCICTFEGHANAVVACAFSPSGDIVLSASFDETVKVWEVSTGHCLHTFKGHNEAVRACAFSPNGDRVYSASENGEIKLWTPTTEDFEEVTIRTVPSIQTGTFNLETLQALIVTADSTLTLVDLMKKSERFSIISNGKEHATVNFQENKVLHGTEESWRLFGWTYYDEELKRQRLRPAEYHGPIPAYPPVV